MDLLPPMEPILTAKIKSGEGWIHQVKWDGIRGMCYINRKKLQVFTKHGQDRTDFYPEIQACSDLIKGSQAVLDGEIIVLDDNGRPSFQRILARSRLRTLPKLDYYMRRHPVNYIIFDLLQLDDRDLRPLPLSQRSTILRENFEPNDRIRITDDYEDGDQLFRLMKDYNMEGIVSKRPSSQYYPGKNHQDWFKIKITRKLLVVIGGIILKNNLPHSLLMGLYREGSLFYIGKAAVGLSQDNIRDLKNYTTQYKGLVLQEKSPFNNLAHEPGAVWLKPLLTCWVQFLEWTETGSLRHPLIIGFSAEEPREAVGKEYLV